jgi:hypothetical protein
VAGLAVQWLCLALFPGFSTLISVLLRSLFGGLYFGIILVFYWLFDWVDCWIFKAPTAPLLRRAALAVAAPVRRTSAAPYSGPISVSFCGPYCGGFIRSIADFFLILLLVFQGPYRVASAPLRRVAPSRRRSQYDAPLLPHFYSNLIGVFWIN